MTWIILDLSITYCLYDMRKAVVNSIFLEYTQMLSNTEDWFQPKLPTETALATITDAIYDNMDRKKIVIFTLYDL